MLRSVRPPLNGFIEPCLPSSAPKPPSGDGWIHEIKLDGFRLLARRDAAGVRLLTPSRYRLDYSPPQSPRSPAGRVDLFLHQQGLDTTTPAGKAMFQMMGVFAEFERAMIQERVRAGLARAKDEGKRLGRPPIASELQKRILDARAGGLSVRKTAARFGIDPSTVQRLSRPLR
jgi:Resolvase, N terminal domain